MRYAEFLLNRVAQMFVFEDLPPDMAGDFLSRELLIHGRAGITTDGTDKQFDAPRIWRGWCGGAVTAEYTGSRFIGASPVLGSTDFIIGEGGAVIYNSTEDKYAPFATNLIVEKKGKLRLTEDPLPYTALYEYILRTADLLENIDISIRSLLRTSRATIFVTAKTNEIKAAAQIVLNKILNGEEYGIFLDDLLNSLNIQFAPTATNAQALLNELKEQYQFMLAEFYHAVGINANYNLKRERLNTAEISVNTDALFINILDMLKCREQGVEMVNKLYGTNIRVRLGDEWQREKTRERDTELEEGSDNVSQPDNAE